jgi:hypothetical protein
VTAAVLGDIIKGTYVCFCESIDLVLTFEFLVFHKNSLGFGSSPCPVTRLGAGRLANWLVVRCSVNSLLSRCCCVFKTLPFNFRKHFLSPKCIAF